MVENLVDKNVDFLWMPDKAIFYKSIDILLEFSVTVISDLKVTAVI